ncbi:phosphotransferase KptA/Tpt1 [Pilaira anomala]|nr:phosphotransferase KptA/Tpt1 [Pilaira anomala]
MNKSPQECVQLSKLLSYVLRHGAVKEKLTISPSGYIAITDLLTRPKFKDVTLEDIRFVVDTNDKKRYELTEIDGSYFIRANQGHSLKTVESKDLLKEIKKDEDLSTPVIHGTTLKAWEIIQGQGLSTMTRNHIHFAVGLPDESHVVSGMRNTSQVYIYIDIAKARADGIVFYRSNNNVILSNGIHGIIEPKYFEKVVNKKDESLL